LGGNRERPSVLGGTPFHPVRRNRARPANMKIRSAYGSASRSKLRARRSRRRFVRVRHGQLVIDGPLDTVTWKTGGAQRVGIFGDVERAGDQDRAGRG
jgi:hypothetical protein